jgi:hypothetical protein
MRNNESGLLIDRGLERYMMQINGTGNGREKLEESYKNLEG